ncbi:hypothetical protein Micbo1qcDRAFT_59944 [Microdochium bolleyi]|uniref:Uncharacterized protein n=1 Tax=Microdochium bolleyi TaxID=196109 RepID=A0A136J4W4_9PEZI|nr:hypothetical protein Micbo1qcDRAFT_59944 [Microdochium bolleyi]
MPGVCAQALPTASTYAQCITTGARSATLSCLSVNRSSAPRTLACSRSGTRVRAKQMSRAHREFSPRNEAGQRSR